MLQAAQEIKSGQSVTEPEKSENPNAERAKKQKRPAWNDLRTLDKHHGSF